MYLHLALQGGKLFVLGERCRPFDFVSVDTIVFTLAGVPGLSEARAKIHQLFIKLKLI